MKIRSSGKKNGNPLPMGKIDLNAKKDNTLKRIIKRTSGVGRKVHIYYSTGKKKDFISVRKKNKGQQSSGEGLL